MKIELGHTFHLKPICESLNSSVASILLLSMMICLSSCIRIHITPFESSPEIATEQVIRAAKNWGTDQKIAIIDIEGSIGMGKCKPLSVCVVGVNSVIDQIKADRDVKAVILNISSNGGEVTVTDVVYNSLLQLKKDRNLPIYAFVQRAAYSGGYYIAMAADEIHALPTSFVGSIGVILVTFDVEDTLSKVGVKPVIIKSVEKKDIGIPLRHMTQEERLIIEKEIKGLHSKFAAIVAKGRPNIGIEKIGGIANGMHFNADDALANGMIDGISYYEPFLNYVAKKANLEDFHLVRVSLFKNRIPSTYSPNMQTLFMETEVATLFTELFESTLTQQAGYYFLGW